MKNWQIEPTSRFNSDRDWYQKKRRAELEAVLNNLLRYLSQLRASPNSRCVQAGYMHHEPKGIIALDQSAGGGNLQETRLYTYADNEKNVLYLITIGNKDSQKDDLLVSTRFVESLKETPST